ncbi:unnamed protein product [Dibothriocephalus latus]|uniref:Uncharacterized protein n=1 Tax=Dibothriocephalus latus TaxID=60516 RepID=A0A3P7LH34_DIBLA|nr:unnamed protein product [Dibothriocephalus latus]
MRVLEFHSRFNNQLAHERALLELLELEHERVQGEVTQAERKGLPPPDLEKTKYEEERESLLVQLRLHQDSPLTRSNCEAQCTPDSAGAASSPTSGPCAENHLPNFFLNSSTDNLVHPSRSEGLSSNRKYHVDDASTTSPSSICNGFAASPVLPKSQSYGSGSSVEPLYSAVRATGVDARLSAVTPAFSAPSSGSHTQASKLIEYFVVFGVVDQLFLRKRYLWFIAIKNLQYFKAFLCGEFSGITFFCR